MTTDANAWNGLDRDPGALYRGSRLDAAVAAFPQPSKNRNLTGVERAFLIASMAQRREEESALRTTSRLRRLAAVLVLLLGLTVSTCSVTLSHGRHADQDQQSAESLRLAAASAEMLGVDPTPPESSPSRPTAPAQHPRRS